MRENAALLSFNRGIISERALARTDIKRTSLSAQTMTNWIARVLGSMMLRPGLEHLDSSHNNQAARYIPFVFSTGDTAKVEVTNGTVRIWVDDEVVTRPAVTTVVTNGTFDTDLTGWSDSDESGASSVWASGGFMSFSSNGTAAAIRDQQVTTIETNTEHALRVVINRGPVTLRVGSTLGGDEYITETSLDTGTHSLAFTPTGNFFIRFLSRLSYSTVVDSCTVESSGAMTITAPWTSSDLGEIRYDQSGDVLFVACAGVQQRRIERRGVRSWSVVKYETSDGPFRTPNTGAVTITPSAISGNISLVSSAPLFRSGHVGSLWRLTSNGQHVSVQITAENTFTNAIVVEGVDSQRIFTASAVQSPAGGATIKLQRSITSEDGPWTDILNFVSTFSTSHDDGLDNQIAWYRMGCKTGDFTSGTHTASLSYPAGSISGIVRVTGFTSSVQVTGVVVRDLGGTSATDQWDEGEWSDFRGWPTAVSFVEGRLCWAGQNGVWLSVTDDFHGFDDGVEGDSGPISRTIGSGPVDTINWIASLQRLMLGAEGAEFVCKSSSFDEPLTPTNFNIKTASTQGSSAVDIAKVDKRALFVQRGGTRVMELSYDSDDAEYGSHNITQLVPEIGEPSIVRIAVQRQPDTRIHCVRSDGIVALGLVDSVEEVLCWSLVETDGDIEDVVVLPGEDGDSEDRVYYHVKRTIGGNAVRYLERWAKESECVGGTSNKQADSFITYDQSASATISGLTHLEGESVVVWDNGKCLRTSAGAIATFTVSGGAITVTNAGASYQATVGVVGLPYTAQWKSSKLAYAGGGGSPLAQSKKVQHIGAILANTHYQGLQYGPTFDDLSPLPKMKDGTAVAEDTVYDAYDEQSFEFEGTWDSDSRVCLQADAPRPCTVLAAVIPVETHQKS